MNIEIFFTHTDPDLTELRQRTERSLADLAPYANITLAKINSRRAPTRPVPQNLPALLIDGTVVPADRRQGPAPTAGDPSTDPGTDPRTSAGTGTGTGTGITADGRRSTGRVPSRDVSDGARALPTEQQITEHLARALLSAGPSAIRLPLVHRRIVALALLLMLAGALTSAFLSIGPILTFTGLLVLPIGLATNGTRSNRQPLMLIAVIAALVSGALLLTYFAPLLFSQTDAAAPPSSVFFSAAVICLGLAWVAAFVAVLARRRLRQRLKDRLLHHITGSSQTPRMG